MYDQHWARVRTVDEYINEFAGTPEKNKVRDPNRTDLTQRISLPKTKDPMDRFYSEWVEPAKTAAPQVAASL
ncbi:MAG: hypothetical protein IIC12_07765 [Proteobacteria bacterium]|nr:hypothetical protein [Pseudomonadota bacterium]